MKIYNKVNGSPVYYIQLKDIKYLIDNQLISDEMNFYINEILKKRLIVNDFEFIDINDINLINKINNMQEIVNYSDLIDLSVGDLKYIINMKLKKIFEILYSPVDTNNLIIAFEKTKIIKTIMFELVDLMNYTLHLMGDLKIIFPDEIYAFKCYDQVFSNYNDFVKLYDKLDPNKMIFESDFENYSKNSSLAMYVFTENKMNFFATDSVNRSIYLNIDSEKNDNTFEISCNITKIRKKDESIE